MIVYRDGIGYDSESGYEVDDGTIKESVDALGAVVLGHTVVSVSEIDAVPAKGVWGRPGTRLILDNGTSVVMYGTHDCCAYTDITKIIQHLPDLDHVITAVSAREGFTRWFLVADMGEVLELQVGWSCGNPFYYAYGFTIDVEN